ncbi:ribonuclease E/G [Kozakia baliensis]|uniref:ribonuclease E/G n=1 Tax=Kozakia baliensis TaxID=153496 RepID=UPI000AC374DD|nr:ribonuclease E/G [Kozakia baliensis]GBR27772.1 hypothetical protein AA0488_1238 [Kozakia baliensis NRIC 0488]GEL64267.1 hypothetical protein KBA01_15530 [Kozakia baliensis]
MAGVSEIRIAWSPGEARIAVMQNDRLEDYALWRPGKPDGYGDLHLVRVTAAASAMGGAFVTLADGAEGFLTGEHQPGDLIRARITRSPQGGKGLRLKPVKGEVSGQEPTLLAQGPTSLEALAERYPQADILVDSPALTAKLSPALRPRLRRVPKAFDDTTASLCEALADSAADLSHGLRATITPTPALTAIDLDDPSPDRRPQTAQFSANQAAFPALAREIRLRNLSGAIVVDPAGVSPRKRPALVPALRAALEGDPMRPQALGATALGLLEIVRTRGRPPLHELLRSPHGTGLNALRQILSQYASATPPPALTLQAAIPVIRALEKDSSALAAFADTYGKPLQLALNPNYPTDYWTVTS